jgi:hypothetical protein
VVNLYLNNSASIFFLFLGWTFPWFFYGYFQSIYVYHMYTCSQTVILPAGARNFPGYLVGFDLLIALHPHICVNFPGLFQNMIYGLYISFINAACFLDWFRWICLIYI